VDTRSEPSISTVERATEILEAFARTENRTMGVTEISQTLGLSKAVVHRILKSLRGKGFVELDERQRRYSLGPRVLELGLTYLRHLDVRNLALDFMHKMSRTTNETATLSIRVDEHRVYIDQVTPAREVKMTVQLGRPFPLHAGSSSKAFLAFLPEEERRRYLGSRRKLEALTEVTITDVAALKSELTRVRERGFATSFGERQAGAGSVAAPVFDLNGDPIAVLSICGPVERFRDEVNEASKVLLGATHAISKKLGYRQES
jgi:IclR family acetate operon transcriptional repressor